MIIPQYYYYKFIKNKFNYELLYIIYFVLVISKFIPRRSLWKQEKCFSLGAIFSKVQRLPWPLPRSVHPPQLLHSSLLLPQSVL